MPIESQSSAPTNSGSKIFNDIRNMFLGGKSNKTNEVPAPQQVTPPLPVVQGIGYGIPPCADEVQVAIMSQTALYMHLIYKYIYYARIDTSSSSFR